MVDKEVHTVQESNSTEKNSSAESKGAEFLFVQYSENENNLTGK